MITNIYYLLLLFIQLQAQVFIMKGGKDVASHIAVCIDLVMANSVQCQVNQSGAYGKVQFPLNLRTMLISELIIFLKTETGTLRFSMGLINL